MKKRFLSVALTVAMVLTMTPIIGGSAFAVTKPQAAENLKWEGSVASWTIPDSSEVQYVFAFLYNTIDETTVVSAVSASNTYSSTDFSKYLIPGNTYCFTVHFRGPDNTESDVVRSADYTVPGTYTKPYIQNLKLNSNGKCTWDEASYAQEYGVKLYEKEGSSWTLTYNYGFARGTVIDFNSRMEDGKTYKVEVVGIQGGNEITLVTESNEFTRNPLTKLATPVGLKAYGGILEWTADVAAKDEYHVVVYDDSDNVVTVCSGGMRNTGKGICTFDVRNNLTVGQKYYFKVTALGDKITYADSDAEISEKFTYNGTWSNLKWDGKTATWDPYEGATSYWVTINKDGYNPYGNGFESDSAGNSYDASMRMAEKGTGDYTFYVVPMIDGVWRDDHASEVSTDKYSYTAPAPTLDAPANLSWDGTIAKWDAVDGATGYSIQIISGGTVVRDNIVVGSETSADLYRSLEQLGTGNYTFAVRARKDMESSVWSAPCETYCSYEEIRKATNLMWDGTTAKWDAVDGAYNYWIKIKRNGYDVYVCDIADDTKFDAADIMFEKGAGTYSFTISTGINPDGSVIYGRETQSPDFEFGGKLSIDVSGLAWTGSSTRTYNGSTQTLGFSGIPSGVKATFTGNKGKSVGSYTAKVSFEPEDPEHYEITGSVADKTWKIVPKKAAIKSITAGKKKLTVKASTSVGSTGGAYYKIGYKVKGSSTWKYTTTKYQSKTITKLKKGKRYYVKVRAYKKVGSAYYYGDWSATKLSGKIK